MSGPNSKQSPLALPPELLRQFQQQAGAGAGEVVMSVPMRPHYELRKVIADAVGVLSRMRGELLQQAALLDKVATETGATLQQLRTAAMGGLDEKVMPRAEDADDLRALQAAVADLAEHVGQVSGANPFAERLAPQLAERLG